MKAQMPNAVDWYSSLLKPNQVYCSLWLIKQTKPFIVSKCVPFNQVYWIARLFQIGKLLKSETQIHSIFILLSSSIFIFLFSYLKWKSVFHDDHHHPCHRLVKTLSSPSLPSFPRKHCDKLATLVATGVSGRSRQTPSVSTKNISNLYILDISGKYF